MQHSTSSSLSLLLLLASLLPACSDLRPDEERARSGAADHDANAGGARVDGDPVSRADTPSPGSVGASASSAPESIELPGGEAGIGFDDLRYSKRLGRVLVPAGRTGNLDLVDPATGDVEVVAGFGARSSYSGGHGDGTTSVDDGGRFLFAIDRTSKTIVVVDASARAIVSSARLAGDPDYVRYVAATNEVWVTEPDTERIEVFRLPPGERPTLEHAASIRVAGGPESLVVDGRRGRAYTHLWDGATVAVDLRTRAIAALWPNGCSGSRGIALDEERGFLFVGCAEGRATVLDVEHDGKQLSSAATGAGVDIVDYDPVRRHLYVPASQSSTLTVLGVSADGELSVLGTLAAAKGAHSVTTDGAGRVFVGDPSTGRLTVFVDAFPASSP